MIELDPLSPAGFQNPAKIINAFYGGRRPRHKGAMRVKTAFELLSRYVTPGESVVLDLMAGIGTTLIAAHLLQVRSSIGVELLAEWVDVLERLMLPESIIVGGDARQVVAPPHDVMLTSPMFPNSHPAGNSKLQKHLLETKGLDTAQIEVELMKLWGCGSNPDLERWFNMLVSVLRPSAPSLIAGGHWLIHMKNYVRQNKVVNLEQRIADRITTEFGLRLVGIHRIPLPALSGFRRMKTWPLREVKGRELGGPTGMRLLLECGHLKETSVDFEPTRRSGCPRCPRRSVTQIQEEYVLAFRR